MHSLFFILGLGFGLPALAVPSISSVIVATPTDTAPLNHELAYYKLKGSNGDKKELTHSFIKVACGATLSVHHTDPDVFSDAGTEERPILLLQHGYPESSYIWRKLTGQLSRRVPLIVADVSLLGLDGSF